MSVSGVAGNKNGARWGGVVVQSCSDELTKYAGFCQENGACSRLTLLLFFISQQRRLTCTSLPFRSVTGSRFTVFFVEGGTSDRGPLIVTSYVSFQGGDGG